MSDPLAFRAWHDGRAAGRAEVAVVLRDLIAELQDESSDEVWFRMEVRQAVERAEARLREETA